MSNFIKVTSQEGILFTINAAKILHIRIYPETSDKLSQVKVTYKDGEWVSFYILTEQRIILINKLQLL